MDAEQTFLRVHARLSGMLSQLLTPRFRLALEYVYLTVSVALFCLLVVIHTYYVKQPGCSSEFSGIEFTEAQLVHIKIVGGGLWCVNAGESMLLRTRGSAADNSVIPELNGDQFTILTTKFWSNWIGLGARRAKLILRTWKNDKEYIESQSENAPDIAINKDIPGGADVKATPEGSIRHPLYAKESFEAVVIHFFHKWYVCIISLWTKANKFAESVGQFTITSSWNDFLGVSEYIQVLSLEHICSLIVQWLERSSKAFEPAYLYAVEKGYFLLSEGTKSQHGVRAVNITISAQNPCFGNRWQQLLINSIVGYDTILTNSLLSSPGQGYLYNFQTKEYYDLSHGHEPVAGRRFGDYFATKCGVLIMSLFVFLMTTMSISFTLRETQSRMLKFTVQLEHHARHQLPVFQLIFVHVIESLVFVPIMIGVLFFLFEFYDDQLLAFLILTLVWLCELFTMVSVRTSISMQFFPRFFLLYFLIFHIYFFSFATYGFSYLAFLATAAFTQHLILYFWNRFEVPALERLARSRRQMQQQAGVQITSYTVTRVNVRNTSTANNEMGAGEELYAVPDYGQAGLPASTEAAGIQEQGPDQNPQQQAGNATGGGSNSFNPFGSILLRLLGGGGGASDAMISFSMFRRMRRQGRVDVDNPRNENEQTT